MLRAHAGLTQILLTMEESFTLSHAADNAEDFALMARIGAGEHAAFRLLVERHQHAVIGTVAKMLGSSNEAQDIAQQVFLRIWRNATNYRPEAKFTTYLFTITRHLVFNETRRRKRKQEVSADEREDQAHQMLESDPAHQPDAQVLQAELQQAVDAAIAALPEAQRLAVVLRRYEQVSYEEIATVQQLSVAAVKSLLFRARTSLRESLRGYLAE